MGRIEILIADFEKESKLLLEAIKIITTDYEQCKVIKEAEEIIKQSK